MFRSLVMIRILSALLVFVALNAISLAQSTAPNPSVRNTTSACNPGSGAPYGTGCVANFNGLTDHATSDFQGVVNMSPPASNTDTPTTVPPASNISWVPFSKMLYPGYSGAIGTKIMCHFQAWWTSGSHGTSLTGQEQTEAYQNQAQNAISRGCNIVSFDWYGQSSPGTDAGAQNTVITDFANYLDSLCAQNGGSCPLHFVLMEDQGTSSGKTVNGFLTDMEHANNPTEANYLTRPSYWKLNVGSCSNRPVVLAFGWGSASSAGPAFTSTDWANLRSDIEANIANCNGQPLLVGDGSAGLLASSNQDGAYNWIGVEAYYNTSTQQRPDSVITPGVSGYMQFDTHFTSEYDSSASYGAYDVGYWETKALSSTQPVVIASAYAGFNDTNASWGFASGHPNGRKMSRECGLVWINSWKQLEANGFSGTKQIQAVGIPTWNDYQEGTAIEPGIDNCLDDSFSLSATPASANWTLQFGQTSNAGIYGTTDTIDHYALWTDDNSQWTQISDPNNGLSGVTCNSEGSGSYSCSAPLTGYSWTAGQHTLYIQAVGKASIQNHLSVSVTVDFEPTANLSASSLSFGTRSVNSNTSLSVTVTNSGYAPLTVTGATVTAGGSNFSASSSGCTVQPNGQGCSITVTFTPTSCGSSYSGTLAISDNAPGSPQTVSLTGAASSANCADTSSLSPSSYNFGRVTVGQQSPAYDFTFKNGSGSTFTPSTSVSNGFVLGSMSGCSNLANGSSCAIQVSCEPQSVGQLSGTLTISYGSSGSRSAALSCTGASASGGGSGTVLYSGIQNMTGWAVCTDSGSDCGGGGGGATASSWTPNLSSPSEPNTLDPAQTEYSADYYLSGGSPAYSNAKSEIQLPSADSVTQFQYDMDVYIDNPNAPQAIVFAMGQAASNTYYPFLFQCDFKGSGHWRLWQPGSSDWYDTGDACLASQFPANTWVHLSFKMNTDNDELNYTSITVGSTTYSLSVAGFSPATESPDNINAMLVLDGDSAQDPYNVYVDNMIIYNAAPPAGSPAISPATLDLGTVFDGNSATARDFTLTNSGTGPYNISSITSNNSQTFPTSNNCGSSLAAGTSCSISVSFTPNGTYGLQSAVITVSGDSTVTANVTASDLQSTTTLYSNVQNDTWTVCNTSSCAGGNGSATSTYSANQASPTINGQYSGLAGYSAASGSGYSNSRFQDVKGAQDSYNVLQMDEDVYISDVTKPQNLQFGVAQAIGGKYYAFLMMCDFKGGGVWRVWNLGSGSWVATSIPCTTSTFNSGDWTHVSFSVERTSGDQMQYRTLSVGSTTYTIDSALYNPATKTPDDTEALFLEAGDKTDDSYQVYLSNVTISHQ